MKILVVSTNKGGDGKTALTRMSAEYFARAGKRVLAIDLDPQCNLSQRFLTMDPDPTSEQGPLPPVHPDFDPDEPWAEYPHWDGRSGIADIFYRKPALPYETNVPGVDILPGSGEELRRVENVTAEDINKRVIQRMDEFLKLPAVQQSYDLVVIDTSPSKGPLVLSAMRAATHALIPCQMEQNSIEGLSGMLQMVRSENKWRPTDAPLNLIGVVINKFRKGISVQEEFLKFLVSDANIKPFILPTRLSLRTSFAERDSPSLAPRSIFDIGESSLARQEAEALFENVNKALFP